MSEAVLVTRPTAGPTPARRRRLLLLMTAGLVDSLLLSMAWTVLMLRVTAQHGLVSAGLCSTAMLVGVALSAPFATWLSRRLTGRGLLRTAGGVEAALRLTLFALLYLDCPLWLLGACIAATNVVAWTGYAGMRAEVSAVSDGAFGLTWYGTMVASVEAVGVALAAMLPLADGRTSTGLWVTMAGLYVLGLVPTLLVAGGSPVPRAPAGAPGHTRRPRRPSAPVAVGSLLMLVASAPPLLAVALAVELHGRTAVGLAAAAFMAGSLLSPVVAGRLQRHGLNRPVTWVLLAAGITAGWALAPVSIACLCFAQVCAGLCMTALEGLLDSDAAARSPGAVTAALARTTAGRALGSAAGSAVFPSLVLTVGLTVTSATIGVVLVAVAAALWTARAALPTAASPEATGAPTPAVDRSPALR